MRRTMVTPGLELNAAGSAPHGAGRQVRGQRRSGSCRASRFARVLPLAGLAACLSAFRSTEGGRREARRECLASARRAGWHVVDISAAGFTGAGLYTVDLLVSSDSVPQQKLLCVYDIRSGLIDLKKAGG